MNVRSSICTFFTTRNFVILPFLIHNKGFLPLRGELFGLFISPASMKKRNTEKNRHVVAWINKTEWDQVLEYLYSTDVALQKYALHRISAWKARFANSSPVAVDCTADLVRCQVLDRSGTLDGDDLVLLYGAALMRFVNLITEKQQGKVARPLRRLAGNLNIPEWVVNLRHDFTHRKLPTLELCRKGCKVVLEWLQREYWSRQLGGCTGEDWESQSDGEDEEMDVSQQGEDLQDKQKKMDAYKSARELLISYEKDQFQSFDDSQEDTEKNMLQTPFADMNWLLGEIKHFASEWTDLLIDVLLDDGFLIPTAEQLETLGCNTSDSCCPSEPKLPLTFLRFWLPLLKTLNSSSFIDQLLEKLFVELKSLCAEQNNHRALYIAAWISELLLCNSNKYEYRFETKHSKKCRRKHQVFVKRIQLRWQQLLEACLEAPCMSTPYLLQLILDDMEHPLPSETQQKLLQLCSMYTQPEHCNSAQVQQQQPIYTLESLHEQRRFSRVWRPGANAQSSPEHRRADELAEKAKALRGSPWQVGSDKVPWKNFPLGKVPGQSDEPSYLMIENYASMNVCDQPVEMESSTGRIGPGLSTSARPAEGLWNQNDMSRLKDGLQLF